VANPGVADRPATSAQPCGTATPTCTPAGWRRAASGSSRSCSGAPRPFLLLSCYPYGNAQPLRLYCSSVRPASALRCSTLWFEQYSRSGRGPKVAGEGGRVICTPPELFVLHRVSLRLSMQGFIEITRPPSSITRTRPLSSMSSSERPAPTTARARGSPRGCTTGSACTSLR
jgi:hypothetical protein